jgi:hypothetical protein
VFETFFIPSDLDQSKDSTHVGRVKAPAGKVIISGGFFTGERLYVHHNGPVADAYEVLVFRPAGTGGAGAFSVWALCARPA